MSKAIIYAVNPNTQVIVDGSEVNFGNVVRKYGKIALSGGSVQTIEPGYYDVDVNITFVAGAAGIVEFILYSNGVRVPGVIASETVETGNTYQFSIPGMIREFCCNPATLSVVVTGVIGTISNAAIVVEKE